MEDSSSLLLEFEGSEWLSWHYLNDIHVCTSCSHHFLQMATPYCSHSEAGGLPLCLLVFRDSSITMSAGEFPLARRPSIFHHLFSFRRLELLRAHSALDLPWFLASGHDGRIRTPSFSNYSALLALSCLSPLIAWNSRAVRVQCKHALPSDLAFPFNSFML